MIVLERVCPNGASCWKQVILIFGLGLIGRSIALELRVSENARIADLTFSWTGGAAQAEDARRIVEFVLARLAQPWKGGAGEKVVRIDLVWCAGTGGFGSTEKQLELELRSFESVLALASALKRLKSDATHVFHMMSSAGGLFEGQCRVGPESRPAPKRPYAELKLQQEKRLADLDSAIDKLIYRPSSVYGVAAQGKRAGLVATLIRNGLRGQVSHVFGEPGTLRDYLFVGDIGRFVASKLAGRSEGSGIFTLACGKPSTISEIVQLIEVTLDRKLYVVFQPGPANADNNTFRREVLPDNWAPTDLPTGVRKTALGMLGALPQ